MRIIKGNKISSILFLIFLTIVLNSGVIVSLPEKKFKGSGTLYYSEEQIVPQHVNGSTIEKIESDPNLKYDYAKNDFLKPYIEYISKKIIEFIEKLGIDMDVDSLAKTGVVLRWIIYIIGAVLIAITIFIIFKNKSNPFRFDRKAFNKFSDSEIIYNKDIDFDQLIAQAKMDQNYKDLVRYYYLLTLRSLDNNGLVEFNESQSDNYYINSICDKKLKDKFSTLVKYYRYVCFGNIFPEPLDVIEKNYSEFMEILNAE